MYASEFDLQPAPSYLADPLRDASRHDSICFASIVRNLLAWLLIPTPSRPTGIGVLFGFLGFRYAFSISLQAVVLQNTSRVRLCYLLSTLVPELSWFHFRTDQAQASGQHRHVKPRDFVL